ncbi:MAG: hypothetical protein CME39_11700 [Haliea sp.]|nr:hypothetical protein [Haliea sp.]
MATKKSYRRYSPEFKREAIKRACEEGITDAAVCKELGISPRQFRRWRDELHLLGEDAFLGAGRSKDDEVTRLKLEVAKVKQERDFVREATALFFAEESK